MVLVCSADDIENTSQTSYKSTSGIDGIYESLGAGTIEALCETKVGFFYTRTEIRWSLGTLRDGTEEALGSFVDSRN